MESFMRFVALSIGLISASVQASSKMQLINGFMIDRTEVSIADFQRFATDTGFVSQAEHAGGGEVYGWGWEQKAGWIWKTPFGVQSSDQLPAVHLTYDEADSYCRWRGARLPTEDEWREAAYTERRSDPGPEFVTGKQYSYPTGDTSEGANCLSECGYRPPVSYSSLLNRGIGPAPVGSTKQGVNGLYDMGANVWEWVNSGEGDQKVTAGGSWWYEAFRMHRNDRATKPRGTAVVYIGFRCAQDIN
jgi:sulfatase modifying factor 1